MQEYSVKEINFNEEFVKYGINYALGVEFKRSRKKMNLTLKDAAENICCQSYLCKIENNMIKPSPTYFTPLCSRLNIDKDTSKYLYNLNCHLYECVRAYCKADYEAVKDIYLKTKKLDNHYADLINIIYLFSIKNYYPCVNKLESIAKYIIKSDYFAYKTFLVCKTIVSFEIGDLKTSELFLRQSSGVMVEYYLDTLVLEYKFYLNACVGDTFTTDIYDEIRRRVDKDFSFPRFDKILSYLILYYLTNKKYSLALNATKGIKDIEQKNNMRYICYMQTKELEKAVQLKTQLKNNALVLSATYNFGGDIKSLLDNYSFKSYKNAEDIYANFVLEAFNCKTVEEIITPITKALLEAVEIKNKFLFTKFSKMFNDYFKGSKKVKFNKKYHEISSLIIDTFI